MNPSASPPSAFILAEIDRLQLPRNRDDIIDPFSASRLSVDEINQYAAEQTRKGVTAWVCAADHQAYDLIRALGKRGISVPEDVSVTGFDGIEAPEDIPDLSTIQIPYHQIGYTAAKRLDDSMKKRYGPTQHILLGCRFNDGLSVARPR